jgi:hypothetical protein
MLGTMADQQHQPCPRFAALWRASVNSIGAPDLMLPNPKPPEIDRLMRLMLPQMSKTFESKSRAVN